MSSSALHSIFQLLKENKGFPNYQAERRIDIFINYFLARFLSAFLNEEVSYLCPEFPLKVAGNNRSTKLDYLCKTKTQPVFVELKTDTKSLKESQALRYINCRWQNCKAGLKEIQKATKPVYRSKFDKLITQTDTLDTSIQIPVIRVIYISPLDKKKETAWKQVSVSNQVKLSDLKINVTEDEIMIWNFIKELDLYIFEVVNSKKK